MILQLIKQLKEVIDRLFEINDEIRELFEKESKTGRFKITIRIQKQLSDIINVIEMLNRCYVEEEKTQDIITDFNLNQKKMLKEELEKINPYIFEHVINELLKKMNYNSIVTQKSNDFGIDIVASINIGITEVTEVIQVKRQQSNIQRPILDQLRGSLHYYNANRGTIITLGNFSNGCKESSISAGVPQIALIDGDKLIDLLFKYQIGVKTKTLNIYSIDNEFFNRIKVESEVRVSENQRRA